MSYLLAFSLFQNAGPERGLDAIPQIIANLINLVVFAAGALSVIFVIVGGIRYAISTGNPASTTAAKKTITYAIGGLLLSMSAKLIVDFVYNNSFLK